MSNMKELFTAVENRCAECDVKACDDCILSIDLDGRTISIHPQSHTILGTISEKEKPKKSMKSGQLIVAIVNKVLNEQFSVDKWDVLVDNIGELNEDEKKYAKYNVGLKAYMAE